MSSRSTPAHRRALIVAYYLSRFDREGYARLGYGAITETHEQIGRVLGVPANTVKNMRDEFDPVHENPRVGWHQRERLSPSRLAVLRRFGQLDEPALREIVLGLLGRGPATGDELEPLFLGLVESPDRALGTPHLIPTRQRTGRLAEEAYEDYHGRTGLPVPGRLQDMRDQECGYDYLIEAEGTTCMVEVKGITDPAGGVLFTEREWTMARGLRERYVLAIVFSPERNPKVHLIRDPASVLHSDRAFELAVRVSYRVSGSSLREAVDTSRSGAG